MFDKNFVMSMLQARVNANNEISQEEFCELFGGLTEAELKEILCLLADNGISIVEEKSEDAGRGFYPLASDIRNMCGLSNEYLCVLYQKGNPLASEALIQKNRRLVYKIAARVLKEYRPESLDLEDLFAEGCIGMLKAAEKFDVSLGFHFSTYACWWIRQAITRETMNNGYTMRLPVHVFDKVLAVKRCRSVRKPESIYKLQEYLAEDGRFYTIRELEKMVVYGDMYLNTISLNDMVSSSEDSDTERMEFLADEVDVENEVLQSQLADELEEILTALLTEREKTIIIKRFGLGGGAEMTLDQVGREFGITRERVRQIEAKALGKLRSNRNAASLREYLCA